MTCDVITCQTLFSIISRTHDATCLLRQLADGFQMSHRLDGPTQLPILAERADQPHTFLLQNKHINKSTCARKDVGSNAQNSRATGADVRAAITATKHPAEYKNGSASVWSLMSTSTNHSITLKILKRFPPVVSFNCMGVFSFSSSCTRIRAFLLQTVPRMISANRSRLGSVFHSHLVPLWPLSSSCPLERDTYSNGLITRGVHFEEVHRDEMKGWKDGWRRVDVRG